MIWYLGYPLAFQYCFYKNTFKYTHFGWDKKSFFNIIFFIMKIIRMNKTKSKGKVFLEIVKDSQISSTR